jgi:hypothetical protein
MAHDAESNKTIPATRIFFVTETGIGGQLAIEPDPPDVVRVTQRDDPDPGGIRQSMSDFDHAGLAKGGFTLAIFC